LFCNFCRTSISLVFKKTSPHNTSSNTRAAIQHYIFLNPTEYSVNQEIKMLAGRALHFVFKIPDRKLTSKFYKDVLGMKVCVTNMLI
jgi:hypothetical protein